jgi:hypothetical protein
VIRTVAGWLDTLMGKRYVVRLAGPEHARAARLAEGEAAPAQVRVRAAVLLAAHDGLSDQQIAARLATSVATAQRTRRRYVVGGFDTAVGWAGDPAGRPPTAVAESPPVECPTATLDLADELPGLVGVALVDYTTGGCLGRAGGGGLDLAAAAAGNARVLRAKLDAIGDLRLPDAIEDILITLSTQYHLIRVLPGDRPLFLYVVLDRAAGNLAMARHQLAAVERRLADDLSGSTLP